ncbi:MAG: PrsW family intramembrane metalloprotease, partial [Verrucomicrobiae bacterium]|nr:PrsW family intramembrane metalloprotease [Verrucomicrobiae bacterium]
MKISRSQLFRLTRDTRFLLRVAIRIVLVAAVAGFVISWFTAHTQKTPILAILRNLRSNHAPLTLPDPKTGTFSEWTRSIRQLDWASPVDSLAPDDPLAPKSPPGVDEPGGEVDPDSPASIEPDEFTAISAGLADSSLPETEKELLLNRLRAVHAPATEEKSRAKAALLSLSEKEPPLAHSAEFLGETLTSEQDYAGAIDAFQLEVDRFPASSQFSLLHLTSLLRQEERFEELDTLINRPDLRNRFPIGVHIERAIDNRDYGRLAKWTLLHDLSLDDPALAFLSLFAGGIWFVITTQFAGHCREQRLWYAGALLLGWLSATATLFMVFIQEDIRGFEYSDQDDLIHQILYYVAGVSLREQLLKGLFFVPLLPLLARRGSEIDALVCAGLVGLGFAINENMGYVARGGEFTAWSRFLTANFAHIAWTGVIGLALFRLWRWPRRQWDQFLYDFLIVVAAHGAYDSVIAIPAFSEYSFVSLIIFALSAYLFLDQASHLMTPGGSLHISPLAVFVIGSAVLIGVTF